MHKTIKSFKYVFLGNFFKYCLSCLNIDKSNYVSKNKVIYELK